MTTAKVATSLEDIDPFDQKAVDAALAK